MRNVVIAGYARSPFTFANKGELRKVRPDELAAKVVAGLLERTGVAVRRAPRGWPLLASAGVAGLAISLGATTMIQD